MDAEPVRTFKLNLSSFSVRGKESRKHVLAAGTNVDILGGDVNEKSEQVTKEKTLVDGRVLRGDGEWIQINKSINKAPLRMIGNENTPILLAATGEVWKQVKRGLS